MQHLLPPLTPARRGAPPLQDVTIVFGGLLASVAILAAWILGAGVTTAATYPAPGPTPGSLLALAFCVVVLGVGAWVLAAYGSRFVRDAETETLPADSACNQPRQHLPRGAIFLSVFGAGLLLTGLALPLTPSLGISDGPLPLYIQPSVMRVPASLIAAGLTGLGGAVAMFALARRSYPVVGRAWWRRTGRYVALGTVAVLAITVPLLTVPVAQSYSTTLHAFVGVGAITFTTFPQGAEVRGSWQSNSIVPVNFTIQGAKSNLTEVGTSGSFSFAASGTPVPLYTFFVSSNVSATVIVDCEFSAPLWAWPPGEPGAPTSYP